MFRFDVTLEMHLELGVYEQPLTVLYWAVVDCTWP